MADPNAQDWSNYWSGRAAKGGQDALIRAGIEDSDALEQFWTETLDGFQRDRSILDLACGAGSALRVASALGFTSLTGLDISSDALAELQTRLPNAKTVQASVHDTGLASGSFDIVVSQYGVEYAGAQRPEAFAEIARLLSPGGDMIIVAHIDGGAIAAECAASLHRADTVLGSGFLDAADAVIDVIHSNSQNKAQEFDSRMAALNRSAGVITQWLGSVDRERNDFARFVLYLLEGAKRQIVNHASYLEADSRAWLRGMEGEVRAYRGRMASMVQSALSEADIERLTAPMREASGMRFDPLDTLCLKPGDAPAAWIIRGRKP